VTVDKEYVYYFPLTDHISFVPKKIHNSFAIWLINKHSAKIDDFWWEEKTRETMVNELLTNFEKEIVFLGEL
jgi:hypothetical protein